MLIKMEKDQFFIEMVKRMDLEFVSPSDNLGPDDYPVVDTIRWQYRYFPYGMVDNGSLNHFCSMNKTLDELADFVRVQNLPINTYE